MALGDYVFDSNDSPTEAPPPSTSQKSGLGGKLGRFIDRMSQEQLERDIGIHPAEDRPFQPRKSRRVKFFLGGGSGVAITDFTPTRPGTRRRLGSF